jgi:hypothetical protein
VKPGLFSNLSSLTDLDLSHNQLTGLKKKRVTWDLPALERLKLSHNRSFFNTWRKMWISSCEKNL